MLFRVFHCFQLAINLFLEISPFHVGSFKLVEIVLLFVLQIYDCLIVIFELAIKEGHTLIKLP